MCGPPWNEGPIGSSRLFVPLSSKFLYCRSCSSSFHFSLEVSYQFNCLGAFSPINSQSNRTSVAVNNVTNSGEVFLELQNQTFLILVVQYNSVSNFKKLAETHQHSVGKWICGGRMKNYWTKERMNGFKMKCEENDPGNDSPEIRTTSSVRKERRTISSV